MITDRRRPPLRLGPAWGISELGRAQRLTRADLHVAAIRGTTVVAQPPGGTVGPVDDDRFAYYRGLLDRWQGLEVALCVTYTHGAGQDDVVRAFGGDPGDTVPLTLDAFGEEVAAYRRTRAPDAVLVTAVGDRAVCVEPNGLQGARREVLRPCSAGGRALSVYWNVNYTNRLLYCVGGPRETRTSQGLASGSDACHACWV